ncbi:substrate-binding domain-containing protein [Sulfuracidifex tepidarius]|uniref:Molybdate/tungstate-binding protein WtpA n=1 Tax=Sulfuracidifex tepidarius TaxID=1294262 RepID=A0A510E1G9_9CREN|nr:substrate-binding domain-containing protein [Sulfuracidifex tepidarius]BBG26333.1 Molybdate/tungstate-binding protein WtpA [Sulfuracidifex tepidarius]
MTLRRKSNKERALSKIQAVVIVVIILVAIAGIGIYLTTKHSSTTSSTTSSSPSTTSSVPTTSTVLTIYVAGAYKAIFNYLASQYQKSTGVTVKVVPGGSFGLAGEIAKETPVPTNLFVPVAFIQAVQLEDTRDPGWAIAFISDHMSLVYTNATTMNPYWGQLYSNYTMAMKTNETTYWNNFFTLLSTHFSMGISIPSSDPEGLYGDLILQMAGKLYSPDHNQYYYCNLAYNVSHEVKTAPSTANFVPDLKAGTLDFVFSYVSYAVSQHFMYLKLPHWLNFGYYPNELSWYHSFSYVITESGKHYTIPGGPVYLYITIPEGASNVNQSINFIEFLVKNVNELSQFSVTPITHPVLYYQSKSDVPSQILNMLNNGELTYGGNFSAA